MRPVLGYTGSGTAQDIARYDEVGIGTADAEGSLRRNLTRAHIAVFTAYAGKAEGTLRFLPVEAVKGRVTANLFHAQQHFSYGRVRRMVQDILLGGKGLAVFGNGLHVVVDAAVDVGMIVIVGMDVVGQTVMTMVVMVFVVMIVMVFVVMVVMMFMVMMFVIMVVMVLVIVVMMMFMIVMVIVMVLLFRFQFFFRHKITSPLKNKKPCIKSFIFIIFITFYLMKK